MSATLLRQNGTNGDMEVMTTAEEYYCAYQAGSWLATNLTVSIPGALDVGTAAGSERSVGSFVNTYFNQAVGTHPNSSITSGSTTTTIKQTNPSYTPSGLTNWRRPATWDTTSGGIKELTDAEMNTICDRLLAYMMANEWYGPNFRVATSAPAGYSSFDANFASDTQSSGVTAANYSFYKKTTAPTAPTTVRPVCLKRATYPSGTYQGIIEMSDTQIAQTFGSWIATRMVAADDQVGRYLLTTSTPAGLGYSGTWASRGTMVDTKDTTSEVDYSADYIGTYTRDSLVDYTGNFAGDYVGSVDYTANYTRNSTTTYTRTSTRNSAGQAFGRRGTNQSYSGYYRNAIQNPIYSRGNTGYGRRGTNANYSGYFRNAIQNPIYFRGATGYGRRGTNANYSGYFRNAIQNPVYANFLGNYAGNYVGDFAGNYLGNYVNENINFTRTSTAIFTGNYVGNYAGNYVGNYVGTTIDATDTTVNTYTLYARTA